MSKRLIILTGVAAAALSLAACHSHHHSWGFHAGALKVGATLICPAEQGRLTLVSASADGRNCAYRGDGEEITLALTPLNGQSPDVVLAPTEASLRTLLPGEDFPSAPPAPPVPPAPPAPPSEPGDNDGDTDHTKVDAPFVHVDADNSRGQKRAKVDVPFVHVDADGDKAHIKVFGMTIDADDDNANVHTDWGSKSAVIKAGPEGAEIRTTNMRHRSTDMVYILAGDHPVPGGYRTVGYMAKGPSTGPLVVATFKTKTSHEQHFHDEDLDQLMSLNVHS